jgi:putative transposase
MKFFNPFEKIEVTKNRLTHWQQAGSVYFVTFRLADSVPRLLAEKWRAEREEWIKRHPEPWSRETGQEYHATFGRRLDQWLDRCKGACCLRDPACRSMLVETLRHGDDDRYSLSAFVIMPNHVHLIVAMKEGADLEKEVAAWKSISARRINRHLERKGTLWQPDYFDRLLRDEDHFRNGVRYLRNNPAKAGIREGEFELHESEAARAVT